jgi:hypothetical protein
MKQYKYKVLYYYNYVLEKQKATKDHGYKCEIWIYDHKGIKLETI